MGNVHVITGATGFVGGAIALELLQQTDDILLCGVRGDDPAAIHARLRDTLRHAAAAYDALHLTPEVERRCIAFPLDLGLAPRPELVPNIAGERVFWHAAASLRYEDRHREQIFRDNVDGTKRVLELARAIGVKRFCYVSTAYVVGKRTGIMHETLPEGDVPTSNCYEDSKLAAEHLVAAETQFETRILRPSVVVGHGKTLAATSFTGLYGFLREVRLFERKVKNHLGNILSMRPLSIMVAPKAPINFVPIDLVARDAVAVGLAETQHRVFHLTNDAPPLLGDAVDPIFTVLGLPPPRMVTSPRAFTSIDQKLHDHLEFYSSYMNSDKTFSRANTDTIVGVGAGRAPLPMPRLGELAKWYLDRLDHETSTRRSRVTTAAASEVAR